MDKRECLLCGRTWPGEGPPEEQCPHCGDHAVRIAPPAVSRLAIAVCGGAAAALLLAGGIGFALVRSSAKPPAAASAVGDQSGGVAAGKAPAPLAVSVTEAKLSSQYVFQGRRGPDVYLGDEGLLIKLSVRNITPSAKVTLEHWSSRKCCEVTDEHGNRYAQVVPSGQARTAAQVNPGESERDELFFERPVPTARKLVLHLPRSMHGGEGEYAAPFDAP